MPSPIISQELRDAWNKLSNKDIINLFKSKNVNVQIKNSDNRHFKIIGSKRKVDLYATTGTVSSNQIKRLNLSYCSFKEMLPQRAIERALTLANLGY